MYSCEGHGTREDSGRAARKNSPVYRDRHVRTVVFGTGETLLRTVKAVKSEPISQTVKWQAAERESEGAIVPMKRGQHNLVEERAHTLFTGINGGKSE